MGQAEESGTFLLCSGLKADIDAYFYIQKTLKKKSIFHNVGPLTKVTQWWQTYHIKWDINDQLNVSFHWFHIFAMILKSWDDVKQKELCLFFFLLVCCSVSNVYSQSLCVRKYPNDALHGSSCPLHCEPTDGDKKYRFWLLLIFLVFGLVLNFLMLFLLFHV